MQEPIFSSQREAIEVTARIVMRLVRVMAWVLLWLAALTLLLLGLVALWAAGVTGTEAAAALRGAWRSSTAQVLTALGLSVLGLIGAAVWLAKKLHNQLGGKWLLPYLVRSPKR